MVRCLWCFAIPSVRIRCVACRATARSCCLLLKKLWTILPASRFFAERHSELRASQPGEYVLTSSQGLQTTMKIGAIPATQVISGPWTIDFPAGWALSKSVDSPCSSRGRTHRTGREVLLWNGDVQESIHVPLTGSPKTTCSMLDLGKAAEHRCRSRQWQESGRPLEAAFSCGDCSGLPARRQPAGSGSNQSLAEPVDWRSISARTPTLHPYECPPVHQDFCPPSGPSRSGTAFHGAEGAGEMAPRIAVLHRRVLFGMSWKTFESWDSLSFA